MTPSPSPLTLGFSPCPNDTFIFYALVHGRVGCGPYRFRERLADVETLNGLALAGELDICKVSWLPTLLIAGAVAAATILLTR